MTTDRSSRIIIQEQNFQFDRNAGLYQIERNERKENKSMVVDPDPIFRGGNPIFHSKQHFRNHVQQHGNVKG